MEIASFELKNIPDSHMEYLSTTEINAIRQRCLGYGRLIYNARRTGLHQNTIRYILARGYGRRVNISKIRNTILHESSSY